MPAKTSKIPRTPTRAEGGIIPEEKLKLDAIAALWTERAFRTAPIEPDKIIPALQRLYQAADLPVPPRIVIVPSPLVLAIAGGAAAGFWHLIRHPEQATLRATDEATRQATRQATYEATRQDTYEATLQATDEATRQATDEATRQDTYEATRQDTYEATLQATYEATRQATLQATRQATDEATLQATLQATRQATDEATDEATYEATYEATLQATDEATLQATDEATRQATDEATRQATDEATDEATRAATDALRPFFFGCMRNWWQMYQGGNMWAWFPAWAQACRDVLGLTGLPVWEKYQAWEDCAIHGGFRIMHPDFCMVTDFPEILKIDAENRPHCEDGPSHRWRDGWSLYYWHGVAVPRFAIEGPETITAAHIRAEENAEVRRCLIERMGWDRFCAEIQMHTLHIDRLESSFPAIPQSALVEPGQRLVTSYRAGIETAELLEADGLRDFEDRPLRFVRVSDPSTGRQYVLRVLHSHTRCYEAIGWTFGMSEADYRTTVIQHS